MRSRTISTSASARWALLLVATACLAGCAAKDGVLRGRVVALADGDTLTVLEGKTRHRIRLTGIDAPERRQPFSKRSTEHLATLVFEREVEVHWTKQDHYGRILGKVLVTDPACAGSRCPKIDVNLRQLEGGYAWWYRQYAREQPEADRATYEEAERRSREARRGLWEQPEPTPPWEWRRDERRSRSRKKAAPERRAPSEGAATSAQ